MADHLRLGGDLGVFADPASVVVVGASANPAKWGYWLAAGALRGAHRRKVYLVNRSGVVVNGVASASSLSDLPEVPELAVLCVPAEAIDEIVDEALDLGVRGFVGITAGLSPEWEARIAARIRAAGARLVGPNCLGVYDAATSLELAWGTFTPGSLAIVSQSGQLGLELAGLAAQAGLGVSRFVSVGDQVDVTAAEVLADLADHPATKAVVLYLESFGDGRTIVGNLVRLGKPVIVLTVGASQAARDAARSHTGALTSGTEIVEAACRAAGAVLAATPAQAVDAAQFLLTAPPLPGSRVAVVGDSGGQGAVAADVLARHGLQVPALPQPSDSERGPGSGSGSGLVPGAGVLPAGAAVRNPIDLAGAGERDLGTYAAVVELLLAGGAVDAVVLTGYFGSYGADTPSLAGAELGVVDALGELVLKYRKPVVVHSMSRDSAAVRALRERGIPTYTTIDQVGWALGLATSATEPRPHQPPPARSQPHQPVSPDQPSGPDQPGGVGRVPGVGGYLGAREEFARYGVPYLKAGKAEDAATMRGPYVVKAAWLAHKTEAGGVVTGLADARAVAEAVRELRERLGDGEYVAEEMDTRTHVVELIVGGRRDAAFGPVVMVGMGGTASELYADVTAELAPVGVAEAEAMLRRLRGYPLMDGWRGTPRVDVRAAAQVVAAVSRLIAEREDVAECEVNPLRVGQNGAIAVDALIVGRTDSVRRTDSVGRGDG